MAGLGNDREILYGRKLGEYSNTPAVCQFTFTDSSAVVITK